ncbi:hypothetical protein MHYP_G00294850 [Metynnis hypsauchen]
MPTPDQTTVIGGEWIYTACKRRRPLQWGIHTQAVHTGVSPARLVQECRVHAFISISHLLGSGSSLRLQNAEVRRALQNERRGRTMHQPLFPGLLQNFNPRLSH